MLLWIICWEHCQEEAVGAGLGEGSGAVVSRFWSDRAGICRRQLPSCCSVLRLVSFTWQSLRAGQVRPAKAGDCLFLRVLWSFTWPLPSYHCFQPHCQAQSYQYSFLSRMLPTEVPFCRDTLHLCPFLSIPPHS